MAQPTISVLDSGGSPVVINTANPNGQALAADSQPVVLTAAQMTALTALPATAATDTVATANGVLLGAVTETAPGTDTASSGLNGRLQRIAQRLTTLISGLFAKGTAGTASADVMTVQGIASMTALKVDGSGVTQPVSNASLPLPAGASTAAKQPALGTNAAPSADVITIQPIDLLPTGGNITAQDTASTTTTGTGGASLVTGAPTAASFLTFALNGRGGVSASLSGTWTGTLQFEESFDGGTTYSPCSLHLVSTSLRGVAFTGNGLFTGVCQGATHFRMRATAAMTGTATLAVVFSSALGNVRIAGPVSIVDNSSAAALTIKAASTAPATSDPAVVVTGATDRPTTAGNPSTFTSTSAATLLAANTARKMATVYNAGAGVLYILVGNGTTVSSTNFTVAVQPGGFLEMPARVYGGLILTAVFGSAGSALVQEMT